MANWLRKLMPKQTEFFPLFNDHAQAIEDGARTIGPMLGPDGSRDASKVGVAVDIGRGVSTEILERIRGAFVTPFDRSDIKAMTSSMQSLLDDMQSVARVRGDAADIELSSFGTLIVKCAAELKQGVARLGDLDKHADDLKDMRDRIAGLRREMSDMRDDAMSQLFKTSAQNPMAAMSGARLLQNVGAVVERFDTVADRIDSLVLDHV